MDVMDDFSAIMVYNHYIRGRLCRELILGGFGYGDTCYMMTEKTNVVVLC